MPDLRFQSQKAQHTDIPRPKRAEGQWSFGFTEPLNKNEQSKKDDDGIVMDVVKSSAFKDFMRTAAREVARGMFKSGRR